MPLREALLVVNHQFSEELAMLVKLMNTQKAAVLITHHI